MLKKLSIITKKLNQLFPGGQWVINESSIGESKQAFIASNGSQKVFIKLKTESPALKRLSEIGVAPKIIFDDSTKNKSYIIQEFVEGEKPDKSWFAQNIDDLANFIKKYHQDKALEAIVAKGKVQSYQENIELVLNGLDDDIKNSNSVLFKDSKVMEVVKKLREKSKNLKITSLVPTHADPNPQNFLLTKKGLLMVDWDDIILSDPMKDIGLILWWYVPRIKWLDFFRVYGKELDDDKLRWWIARNTFSIAAWYGKMGNSEYVKFFIDDAIFALEGKDNSQIYFNKSE